jgi:hypothetical protein
MRPRSRVFERFSTIELIRPGPPVAVAVILFYFILIV